MEAVLTDKPYKSFSAPHNSLNISLISGNDNLEAVSGERAQA